jgi:hypothetical protein
MHTAYGGQAGYVASVACEGKNFSGACLLACAAQCAERLKAAGGCVVTDQVL